MPTTPHRTLLRNLLKGDSPLYVRFAILRGAEYCETPQKGSDPLCEDLQYSVVRGSTRREALWAGGVALVAAGMAAAPARAETDEGGLLLGLWRREMGAALAYDRVAHRDPVLPTLRGHEADHAAALATELAAVGLGTPKAPRWASELDATAERLARAEGEAVLPAAVALEEELVALYRSALPSLPDAKIAMTAATILASHAQHLFILRHQTGPDPLADA
jgi:hypothetical protein